MIVALNNLFKPDSFLSFAVRPRRIVKTLGIIMIAVIVFASTIGLSIQKRTLAFPTSWGIFKLFSSDDGTVKMEAKQTAKVNYRDPNRPWIYSFVGRPDGTVSKDDWNFESGTKVASYNDELQTYTDDLSNIRVENGKLIIEARKENRDGRQYTSARINSYGAFEFSYGTLEVNMKVPEGRGTWPAAWLLPKNNVYKPKDFGISADSSYAWALNGEIDFAESIGALPGQTVPAIHSFNEVQRDPTYTPGIVKSQSTKFHRYGVIKTHDSITFTLDGKPYATRKKFSDSPLEWPFNQPYYLVLNLAVGGNWAGDYGVDNTGAPWQLQVKSISYTPLAK